jgi:hypothetical protein
MVPENIVTAMGRMGPNTVTNWLVNSFKTPVFSTLFLQHFIAKTCTRISLTRKSTWIILFRILNNADPIAEKTITLKEIHPILVQANEATNDGNRSSLSDDS